MKAVKVAIWFLGAVVAAILFVAGAQTSSETNSSPVDIFVQPIKTHLEAREEIIRQLRAEVVQLRAQTKAMVPPPLPEGRFNMRFAAQMAPLNVTLLDDHIYSVHVPDGMRITSQDLNGLTMQVLTDLMRTNRSATVIWLSPK